MSCYLIMTLIAGEWNRGEEGSVGIESTSLKIKYFIVKNKGINK